MFDVDALDRASEAKLKRLASRSRAKFIGKLAKRTFEHFVASGKVLK